MPFIKPVVRGRTIAALPTPGLAVRA